jgi:Bacterial extracellular solute-binding protein
VNLSLEPDVTTLVRKGIVPKSWNAKAHRRIVTHSVVVFVVRDGNPKHIKGWGDLVKKGIEVITPNPFTSGGARWNVMAAYGAQRWRGATDKQAIQYLYKLFHHVPAQPDSARAALQIFAQGEGDVLLTYENEALYANRRGVTHGLRHPRLDDPDRKPCRPDEERRRASGGEGVSQVPLLGHVAEDLRRAGLSACDQDRLLRLQVQAAEGSLHDRHEEGRPERMEGGAAPLLPPEHVDHGQGRAVDWPVAQRLSSVPSARFPASPAGRLRAVSPPAT